MIIIIIEREREISLGLGKFRSFQSAKRAKATPTIPINHYLRSRNQQNRTEVLSSCRKKVPRAPAGFEEVPGALLTREPPRKAKARAKGVFCHRHRYGKT